eukprot:TRINITY_DN11606_c0_g1_i1.p1 TRINITY_DN11606_c0_g1~~TRINITY_DN11606_c0_g1_i1.p1  ORF type:complete len:294 (-),score=35.64 TRINITY_DN11606_c0_g1_i1:11-892(-)
MEGTEDVLTGDMTSGTLTGLEDETHKHVQSFLGDSVHEVEHSAANQNVPARQSAHPYDNPVNHATHFGDERQLMSSNRDSKWLEIRKFSDFIRRFASTPDVAHIDITKENFYDLYNSALGLLKAIDGLDPDKANNVAAMNAPNVQPTHLGHLPAISFAKPPASHLVASPSSPIVAPQGSYSPMGVSGSNPMYYRGYPAASSYYAGYGVPAYSEVMMDGQSSKKKSSHTPTSNKRNLQCTSCGVTKTPEWRRGPSGDHTLCNACGLQYAKTVKKKKKENERKAADLSQVQALGE